MGVSEPAHRAPQLGGSILRRALAQLQKLLPPFPCRPSRRPAPPPRPPSPPPRHRRRLFTPPFTPPPPSS
eukprot:3475871-Prymnesium_polylepis.1